MKTEEEENCWMNHNSIPEIIIPPTVGETEENYILT